jgi:hypothetical protein
VKRAWILALLAACGRDAAPPAGDDVDRAIARASAWLAAFPGDQLRYDAAIGTAAIRRHADGEAIRRADATARAVADRDADNPMRRMIDPAYRAPATSTAAWEVPAPGGERVNVNRVVVEALHCADNGLREQTIAYATGPMRDDGGFHTTHAVWALAIARDAGCLDGARFEALVRPLLDELRAAQPAAPGAAVRDVDLFAERVLMLRLAGDRDAAIDGWARALAAAQTSDGGFGTPADGENPYFRYHATLAATWALVEWQHGR